MNKGLRDFTLEELKDLMIENNFKSFRAKQIFSWVHKGIESYDEMNNIPKKLKEFLKNYPLSNMTVYTQLVSKIDGTKKFLLKLNDGNIIECVLMKYKHGNTICVSSQVGCRMKCTFCASAINGLERNLTAGEILGQIFTVEHITGDKISNIVLMGSGEPLDNYDEVLKFIKLVNDENGRNISMRSITLSTCGIVDNIYKLMKEKLPITLAISLHSTDNQKRNELMPVNKAFNIESLLKAAKEYAIYTGRRVTFEYALIEGVNDSQKNAERLAFLLKDIHCHVNLIPINPVVENTFKSTKKEFVINFEKELTKRGIKATIRRELGTDIDGACGQLRNKHL